jgi:2-oxoacid:acceptor oxidoreductase gamma subunit (pyruvate/2-ketoisovalerate family)
MHQIRIHGRGGQGVVTAAELIAIAAFQEGRFAQAFPFFGVERTGAPIQAFARIDDKEIRLREQIYNPDVLIIQDASLIGQVNLTAGTDAKTVIIVNTAKTREEIAQDLKLEKNNIHTVDATKIALEIFGKNLVNTTILGAVAKATGLISLPALKKAAKKKFQEKGEGIIEKNIKAIESTYYKVL